MSVTVSPVLSRANRGPQLWDCFDREFRRVGTKPQENLWRDIEKERKFRCLFVQFVLLYNFNTWIRGNQISERLVTVI